ncbi:MAG: alpha-L-fucosidase [Thermoguttaceae bacterium]|jgi:autotransporter-associated beta strand protein
MKAKFFQSILSIVILAVIASSVYATDLSVLKQDYVDQQYGLFLHYNMGTYVNQEWTHSVPMSSINTFSPTAGLVNTDQWAATAVAAGMKYGVLTTKHHDGFALWDTTNSTYDIASTSWYATYHQDIVGSFVNSFRNAGLGVGLYYSFWDKYNGIGITPYYSDDATLGRKSSADATAYVKSEISQLLTNYGQIDVLWVDGWGWANTSQGCPYSDVNYADVYSYIHTNWPNTLLVNNINEGNTNHTDVIDYETQFSGQMPPVGNTIPSEGNATLRSDNGWFYTGSPPSSVGYKSASYVGAVVLMMNSRNASYLLDVPPDTTGTIPTAAVTRLTDIKAYLAVTPKLRTGNMVYGKTATQSSTDTAWGGHAASLATNTDRTDFTHTNSVTDFNPWWKIDLTGTSSNTSIEEIEIFNRVTECGGRLRDITVDVLAADGTTVVWSSGLLNPNNSMGGGASDYANGPTRLCVFANNGVPVLGRYVRVTRTGNTPDSGDTTVAQLDDHRDLSLSDVEVYAARPNAITWTGSASGVWDVNTTANWFNNVALIADKYHVSPTADSVSFSDSYDNVYGNAFAPTTTTVTLNTTVSPSTVVFDANTLNYTLSGTGGISGGTSLVKTGSGTVTISTANGYTGGTILNGGTLSINSDAALGAAAGTVTINKTGSASAVLKITSTFALANNRPIEVGAGGGAIEVLGSTNTLTVAPLSTTAVTFNGPLTVQGGGTLTLNLVSAPTITAPQTLTIAGGVTPTTLNVGGTADPFTSGAVSMDVVNNGNLNITAGSKKIGALSGTGNTSLAGNTQLTVDSLFQNILSIGAGSTLNITPLEGGSLPGSGSMSEVPEPSTWAMLMLAAMGMGIYWRCNR